MTRRGDRAGWLVHLLLALYAPHHSIAHGQKVQIPRRPGNVKRFVK